MMHISEVIRSSIKVFFPCLDCREVLQTEAQAKMQASNPANFGPKKYCLRECICEVEGQVPCPGTTPLPREMTGKYRTQMAASQE